MRALGACLAAFLLLPGCTVSVTTPESSDPSASDSEVVPTGTTSVPVSTSTTPAGNGQPYINTVPEANLTADATAGNAPVAVTFTLNATDADGDALQYNVTFGDGTPAVTGDLAAAAEVTHTFVAPGSYVVVLNVSDGQGFGLDEVTVTVAAPAPQGGQTANGAWLQGTIMTGCFGDILFGMPNYPGPMKGITYDSFAIDPATIGLPYVVTFDAEVADSPGFTFLNAAGGIVAAFFLGDGPSEVPGGAATGVFWVCAGGPASGTYVSGSGSA